MTREVGTYLTHDGEKKKLNDNFKRLQTAYDSKNIHLVAVCVEQLRLMYGMI